MIYLLIIKLINFNNNEKLNNFLDRKINVLMPNIFAKYHD